MNIIEFWLISFVIAQGIEKTTALTVIKKLADDGYKINRQNSRKNYLLSIINLIPIINIVISLFSSLSLHFYDGILKELKKDGILLKLSNEEKEEYQQNPTLLKALLINRKTKSKVSNENQDKNTISKTQESNNSKLIHRKIVSIQEEKSLTIDYEINTDENELAIIETAGNVKDLTTEELENIILDELNRKLEDLTSELETNKPTQKIIDNNVYKEALIKQRQILIEERETLVNTLGNTKKLTYKKNIK
jgi:hypothetical protein